MEFLWAGNCGKNYVLVLYELLYFPTHKIATRENRIVLNFFHSYIDKKRRATVPLLV